MKRSFAVMLMMLMLFTTACSGTDIREAENVEPTFANTPAPVQTDGQTSAPEPTPTETPAPTPEPTTEETPSPTPEPTQTVKPTQKPTSAPKPAKPYLIRINRIQNCVTVYAPDENGEYTVPYKAFICSTGTDTPTGSFSTTDKYVWRALFGDVYGQYATRIVGTILFHSVPYHTMNKDDLEWEEYNKLGTAASMGCIRLTCADAKWIYDNCPKGTTVEIYDDEKSPGPLGKPDFIRIDENSEYRGWDPTDPDPKNPWNS